MWSNVDVCAMSIQALWNHLLNCINIVLLYSVFAIDNSPFIILLPQVCEEEEVLELDAQSLGDLLGSDDLNISQEEVVLELVLRWVERRRGDLQSKAQAVELIRRVRLELVDPQFLRKTRRRNPVREEREGRGETAIKVKIPYQHLSKD